MMVKYIIYLVAILLFAYLIIKVLVQNVFVVNKRLDMVREGDIPSDDGDMKGKDFISDFIDSGQLYKIPLLGKFYKSQIESLKAANIDMKPKEYLLASVGVFILFLIIVTIITGEITLGLVFGVIGMLLPNLYVGRLKSKRRNDLEEQLPDFLNTLSNALRSGLSFQQGIDIATEETLDPVKWEFRRVLNDMTLGRPTKTALNNLKDRTQNKNIDMLVNAVNVQMDVGGDMSEILDLLAETIRANARLQRHFKSTIAQNKLSGIIIGLLPIALAGILTVINPQYMMPLYTDSLGRMMLIGAILMMGLGMFVIKKLTELEV